MSANKQLQTLQNKLDDLSELTTLIREARDADVAELNAENDEINRKWAEDNERHTDVMAEQQEQIIRLEQENKKLQEENKDWKINFKEERQENKELKKGDKSKLKKKVLELEKEIEVMNEHTQDYDTEVEMRSLAEKQVEELQNENELLKDCDIMKYSYLVQGENKLLKEWQDMNNELGWCKEHIEILEKQLDRRD